MDFLAAPLEISEPLSLPGQLNPHGEVDNVTGGIDPNHETGGLPFLGSCFDFVEACGGEVYGGGLEESVQIPEAFKVLDGHRFTSLEIILGRLSAG